MDEYNSGVWAMTFCFSLFLFYTYFKNKYSINLWFGIGCTAITIWALYESWTFGVLKEDFEYGIYLIIICFVIGFAVKISTDRSNKKREALWKKNEEEAQNHLEGLKVNRREEINTTNNKVSAHLLEYRDFIVFNEYTIGKEVYGASINEEFHTYIKIQKKDIGKFNYDLILKFLNESTKYENYLSPSISLQGLCRVYSMKFEEMPLKKPILKSLIELSTSIRDFNGLAVALAKTVDGGSAVVTRDPLTSAWTMSSPGGVDVADVLYSPNLVPDEKL